jgi:hypothetical protein
MANASLTSGNCLGTWHAMLLAMRSPLEFHLLSTTPVSNPGHRIQHERPRNQQLVIDAITQKSKKVHTECIQPIRDVFVEWYGKVQQS